MFNLHRSTILLAVFIYAVYAYIMPPMGHDYDMGCFAGWAVYIFNNGLREAYNSETNYLPGHLYELALYAKLQLNADDVLNNIYQLKYATLIFDIVGALMLSSFAKSSMVQNLVILVMMLNPVYLHNSIIWGQYDSVFSCFALASFIAMMRKKLFWGIIFYVISLNFKLQAIIFAPVLGFFLMYQSWDKLSVKLILKYLFTFLFVQAIILIPFMHGDHLSKVWGVVKGQAGIAGNISLNAANIWHLFFKGNIRYMSDSGIYNGLTLKTWGLIMYCASVFLIIIPFIKFIIYKFRNRQVTISSEQVLIMLSLSPLAFFYFNTQMHERYSYPTFLFIAAYSFISQRWYLYGLFSLCYFLNNDKLMQCITKINYNSSAFEFRNISLLFLILITILFILHLRSAFKSNKTNAAIQNNID